jgi:hypothetical protein
LDGGFRNAADDRLRKPYMDRFCWISDAKQLKSKTKEIKNGTFCLID